MMHRSLCAIVCCSALLAAGCGGSSDDDDGNGNTPAATEEVPASASESVNGFIAYMKQLVASTDTDTLEPVDVSKVKAPLDNIHEPSAI